MARAFIHGHQVVKISIVFVFGGSTTFGYGVSDAETITSYLYEYLKDSQWSKPPSVNNFGRGYYVAMQENILFQKLLRDGNVPQLVIFIDGLNEFYFARDDSHKWIPPDTKNHFVDLRRLRIVELSHALLPALNEQMSVNDMTPFGLNADKTIRLAFDRYRQIQKIISSVANGYGIRSLFVLQPVPTYRFDIKRHPFAKNGFESHALSGQGYAELEKHFEVADAADMINLSGLNEQTEEYLYVDLVHYSAVMNRAIASRIAKNLIATTKR